MEGGVSPLSLKAVPRHLSARLEERVEADGEQVGLWLPVALGLGAALWFALPRVEHWIALITAAAGAGLVAWRLSERRWARAVAWGALALAAGLALAWARGIWVSHPVLERPVVVHAVVRVDEVEDRPAEGKRRAVVQLLRVRGGVPPVERARLSFPAAGSHDVRVGAVLKLRIRLMPPPGAALPGAYDFARTAWFGRLGATGTPLGIITVLNPAEPTPECARVWPCTSGVGCQAEPARSRRRWPPATGPPFPKPTRTPCAGPAWRICSRSAAFT